MWGVYLILPSARLFRAHRVDKILLVLASSHHGSCSWHPPDQRLKGCRSLNSGSQYPTVGGKGGHRPHPDLLSFIFIRQDLTGKLAVIQRCAQNLGIEADVCCQPAKDIRLANIIAVFEEGSENGNIILSKSALAVGPFGRFVGKAGTGLHRR